MYGKERVGNMRKKFLVTSYYRCKKTGVMVSGVAEVNEGISKDGNPYGITTATMQTVEGQYPLGTILTAEMNLSIETPAQTQRAVKQVVK